MFKESCFYITRYLATGNSQVSLAFNYRISPQAICGFLREVMLAICEILGPIYLPTPTEEIWRQNEKGFNNKWNFPNAVGSIDGKHCRIIAPTFGGSTCYNYKHFHSLVL